MYGDTRKYMTGIFSGQTPIRRTNPKMGESEYYYFKPNQEGWSSLSEVETVDVPTKDTPNPFLQPQTNTFGQPMQLAQNNNQMNDSGIVNGENQQAQFDFIRGKDMGNGWETTPDFSYLNNSPLHMGLTANKIKNQKELMHLDTSVMGDREILDTPYSKNNLVNDCMQSERFYPFAMRVRWNEGENQGITYATKENSGTDQNTKYGISQRAYDGFKGKYSLYPDEVKDLTAEQAMNLQCQEYYKPGRIEAINDANTAFAFYDSFFNGYDETAKAWQQTLRGYGNPNLQIGGGVGSGTVNALNKTILSPSFKQDLIRNRLGSVSQDYNHGLYNRMNTYNIGNK